MLLLATVAAALVSALGGPAGADPAATPASAWGTDGEVLSTVIAGSTAYIGGNFTHVGSLDSFAAGKFVALDSATGQAHGKVEPITPAANEVFASAPDGNGGWFVGGLSTFMHILADGRFDPVWAGLSHSLTVTALAVSGSTVYVGGDVAPVNGPSHYILEAFDATTGAAKAFNPDVNGYVRTLAVSADGTTVYAGGDFTMVDGSVTRNHLAAFDASSGAVRAFDPDLGGSTVHALALDGTTVYAGGSFSTVGATHVTRHNLAAFDASSGADLAFDPDVNAAVYALARSGSTLVVGGDFTAVNGSTTRKYLVELELPSGDARTAFVDPNVNGGVGALAVSGGTVYAGGSFTTIAGSTPRDGLAAFDLATGAPTPFSPLLNDGGVATLGAAGSEIYAGGSFRSAGGVARNGLAAIDLASGDETSFDPDVRGAAGAGAVEALALSGSSLYAGGIFTAVNGTTARHDLAAFSTQTGTAETSFAPEPDQPVFALAAAGSTVYAGGDFTHVGGAARNHLAAVDATSGLATGFDPDVGGEVDAIATAGSLVYAGGSFASVHGATRHNLASFSPTGAVTAFAPNLDGAVYALAATSSTVYVGGDFTHVDSVSRNHAAAFDLASGTMTSFDPNVSGSVDALAPVGGTIYLGGFFASANGSTPRSNLASVDTTGELAGWRPDPDGTVLSVAAGAGRVLLGGGFGTISGGVPAQSFAFFDGVPGAPTGVSAAAGNGNAIVSFSPPAESGTNAVTSYTVTAMPGGATASGSSSPITVLGLQNGTSYTFTVTATNVHGTGPASAASNAVTPSAPPSTGGGGGGGGGLLPDLAVTISASAPTTPAVGGGLLYFVKVFTKNLGGSSDVRLTLTLPIGFALDHVYTDRGSCTVAAPTIVCDVAWINDGTSTNLIVFGSVAQSGELDLRASVQSQLEPEFDPSNNATTFALLPAVVVTPPPPTGGGGPVSRPAVLHAPTVAGRAAPGRTLRATPPRWSVSGVKVKYAWQLCTKARCKTIAGARTLKLVVRRAYRGHSVRFVATGTKASVTLTSVSKRIQIH